MLGLFNKKAKRVVVSQAIEIDHVFRFAQAIPEIVIFENNDPVRLFRIESLDHNSDLSNFVAIIT